MDKSVNGQTNRRLASNVWPGARKAPLGVCLEDSRALTVAFMVSGWWLLAAPWIGGCLGILFAMGLYKARHRDDPENQRLLGTHALTRGGKQTTPNVWPGQPGGA